MKMSKEQLAALKQHGFMWHKDGTTDKVDDDCIESVIPAANGFTVVYNQRASALELSTAEVESIEFPADPSVEWIRVNWTNIVDQRREDGFVFVEEDGRRIRDACYHCANTGFISPEQHRLDQIEGMAASLATSVVQKMKRDCNSDPEGEGWAFQAAESGMREYEYTTSRIMAKADDFGRSLVALDQTNPQLISALLDRMAPDIEIEDCPPILVLVREEDPADDVPF